MKAVITSASGLDKDYNQEVAFNIVHGDNDEVLLSHTIKAHIDSISSSVEQFVQEWGAKYLASDLLKEGDTLEA